MVQDTFLGEILGAVVLASDDSILNSTFQLKPIKVSATGVESEDGQITIDKNQGKPVKILEDLDDMVYYDLFATRLGDEKQSAVIGSFDEQRRIWSTSPNRTGKALVMGNIFFNFGN